MTIKEKIVNIQQQIEKLMERKSGVTLNELIERGFNANTARRVLGGGYTKQISRKCRITGKYACAYVIEDYE